MGNLKIITFILLLSFFHLNASELYPYITPIAVEEAPVFDKDKDGVIDENDKCPKSKEGDVVNEIGCLNTITVVLVNNNKEHNAIVVSTKSGSTLVDKVNEFVEIYSAQQAPTQAEKISKEGIKDLFPYVVPKSDITILKYTLYFKEVDSLNSSSKEKLLEIISKINERENAVITVIGHTDTVGSSKINDKLARKRANYVIDAIKKNGAKFLHSEIESYGENNLAVETADNTLEVLNRRVEILIR